MSPTQGGSVGPWLLLSLGTLVVISLLLLIKSWRDAKRSPYFFMRRQAQHRMQNYALVVVGLLFASLFASSYAAAPPVDNIIRSAVLSSAKPVSAGSVAAVAAEPNVIARTGADTAQVVEIGSNASVSQSVANGQAAQVLADSGSTLAPPAAYNRFEGTEPINDATRLSPITFSQAVDRSFRAQDSRRIFASGRFTLYATFEYEGMADGMSWAWVWRRDGAVIGGGNELWAYGADGPGFVFLNPPEGFEAGEYTVEVWINSELMAQANAIVTAGAATTNQ